MEDKIRCTCCNNLVDEHITIRPNLIDDEEKGIYYDDDYYCLECWDRIDPKGCMKVVEIDYQYYWICSDKPKN